MTSPNYQKCSLQLLHTSDLHIGNDLDPDEALRGFEQVLAVARRADVDAVLVAGDLFDTYRVPTETVQGVLDDLKELRKPVVVLPGNHDTVLKGDKGQHSLPSNVTLILHPEGEMVNLVNLGLSVWGRPVYDHHPGFRPLAEVALRPGEGWYVVMAHGLFVDHITLANRSAPISPEEVANADCDYVALGHVHLFRDVSQGKVPAFYCGAPSGPQARSVAIVALNPDTGVTVTPVPFP